MLLVLNFHEFPQEISLQGAYNKSKDVINSVTKGESMQTTYPLGQQLDSESRTSGQIEEGTNRLAHLSQTMTDIGHKVSDGHKVGDKSKVIAQNTDECVHRHAWKAIGLMSIVGLLAGFFMNRR
jgi:ElaB/YqjD/DUF883 family membrane-anchored ribosome-binding protein